MKFTAILLFVASLQVGARSYSQNISLRQKNASLVDVFKAIEQQTGYTFLYEKALLLQTKKIDIEISNASLAKVLDLCFKDQPLTYKVFEKTIVIRKKEPPLDPVILMDQPLDLSGKIMDPNGSPLEGATIKVVGSNKSTTTDLRGEFVLRGIEGNAVLQISFIGYKTQTVHVDNRRTLNVGLALSDNKLDQTVVIAYGTTTERYNTGSVTKVTAEQIEKQPVANVLQSLQGLVPGLDIQQDNGYASGKFEIAIRGRKDLGNPGNPSVPLYVVDGVPLATSTGDLNNAGLNQNGFLGTNGGQSPLYSINPADIESVEVLRDADATAIYGSRAANGVILITTKKGKPGAAFVQLNAYTGWTSMPHKLKLLNTPQYLAMRREAFANDGITPDASNAPDLVTWDTTRYTDWQKKLGSSGKTSDLQLSYSGGNEFTNFRLSGAFHNQAPPIPDGMPHDFHDQRLSALVGLSHISQDRKFKADMTVNFANTNSKLSGGDFYQYDLPPNAPSVLDSSGKLNWKDWGTALPYNFTTLFQPYKSNTNDLLTNLTLSYTFFKGFSLTTSLGYTNTTMEQVQAAPASTQGPDPSQQQGYTGFGYNHLQSWIVEPRAVYNTRIADGNLQVMAGGTLQQNVVSGNNITAYGFANDALLENLASATTLYANSNYSLYRFQGYFTRLNYIFKRKYIVDLSGRRDGSSRFKAGNQMGNFGSVGAAWLFSEEDFVKQSLPFLSFGKLRGSFGNTGSAASGDYRYLSLWQSGSSYGGTSSLNLITPANQDYKWQVNKKEEAALELGFLKERISLSVAFYREHIGNQLVNYPLPAFTGFYSVTANLQALVQNQGWEMTLNTTNIKSPDFSWTSLFNISINRNKLVSYPNLASSSYASTYIVGKSMTIQRLLHYQGVDPQTGQYQFEDVNKDGVITTYSSDGNDDRVGKYDKAPVFFGGFQNEITYKGWQLTLLLQFKKQKGPWARFNGIPGSRINQLTSVLDRQWKKPGDNADIGPFSTYGSTGYYNYLSSDAGWGDASYIRMQNMSFSYNFKGSWMKKVKMASCRLYLQGQNLFTITSYKGNDPANPSLSSYGLPPQKFYTGGIQFTF